MRRSLLLLAMATLAQGAWSRPPGQVPPRPSTIMAQTYPTCRWGKVDGRTLSIWSYDCGKDGRLVPADDIDGFAIVSTGADGPSTRIVVRAFGKPAAAPIGAVLPAVLRATGPHKASCQLVRHTGEGEPGAVWRLEPTGAEKKAFDAANRVEPQPSPCGTFGTGVVGEHVFRPLPDDPSRIVYLDLGSELQMFDPATLRSRR